MKKIKYTYYLTQSKSTLYRIPMDYSPAVQFIFGNLQYWVDSGFNSTSVARISSFEKIPKDWIKLTRDCARKQFPLAGTY